jgi:hypothetical protein
MPSPRLLEFLHADYLAQLSIRGVLVDAKNNPAVGAEVYFLDEGLDYVRSEDPFRWMTLIGKTNRSGKLSLRFDYMWGVVVRASTPPRAAGDFRIRVQYRDHVPHEARYSIEDLKERSGREIVDLGTVKLRHI